MIVLDCFAGISGDMFLGAAIDLGVSPEALTQELRKLELSGWELQAEKVISKGISGSRCRVELRKQDHREGSAGHEEHENQPDAANQKSRHHHRTCKEILDLIEQSELKGSVKRHASSMFRKLAEAEGKIHGMPWDQVHFHEVGAVDSIIDLVGAAVCMDLLDEEQVFAGDVNVGSGYVHCAHGWFPVPAPAVLEVLRGTGIGIYRSHASKETTTPTGAVILAEYFRKEPDRENRILYPEKIGYGFGTHELEIPNALRMIQGREKYQVNKGEHHANHKC